MSVSARWIRMALCGAAMTLWSAAAAAQGYGGRADAERRATTALNRQAGWEAREIRRMNAAAAQQHAAATRIYRQKLQAHAAEVQRRERALRNQVVRGAATERVRPAVTVAPRPAAISPDAGQTRALNRQAEWEAREIRRINAAAARQYNVAERVYEQKLRAHASIVRQLKQAKQQYDLRLRHYRAPAGRS
jgi:hypothetical protein